MEKIVLDLSILKFLGQSGPSVGDLQNSKHETLIQKVISIILKVKLTPYNHKSRNTLSNFLGGAVGTNATEVEGWLISGLT